LPIWYRCRRSGPAPPATRTSAAPALIERKTDGTTPFRLNLHAGDVGHTLIVGPTGAGKSVLLSLLAMQWTALQRRAGLHVRQGRLSPLRCSPWAVPGMALAAAGRPALQPLSDIDTPRGAAFAADWLAGLCRAEGLEPDATPQGGDLGRRCAPLVPRPPERTLTGPQPARSGPKLKAALAPFTLEGPYRPPARRR
jgi:type IV secretion system protein TrbE